MAGISASASTPDRAPNTLPKSIEVFNLRDNWEKVKPHLAKVATVLTKCMKTYLAESEDEYRLYDPIDAPWKTSTNFKKWLHIQIMHAAERGEFTWERPRHDASQEVVAKTWEEYRVHALRLAPKPDTFDWYYSEKAEYYMAPWLIALGEQMFPEFIWAAMSVGLRSFAGGIDLQGKLRILFDRRSSESPNATELLKEIHQAKEHHHHKAQGPRAASTAATPSSQQASVPGETGSPEHGDTHLDNKAEDGTLVEFNGLLMAENQRAEIEVAQTQQTVKRKGVTRERIRYGEEIINWGAGKHPCRDCFVIKGQIHVFGCDVEECPFCGEQVWSCSCGLKIPKSSRAK